MIIELGDNGLRSRYHWTAYDIDDGAIQSHILAKHIFLYDEPAVAAYR